MRVLGVPFIVVSAVAASYIISGWPIFAAMHTNEPDTALRQVASVVTVALGLLTIAAAAAALRIDVRRLSSSPETPRRTSEPAG